MYLSPIKRRAIRQLAVLDYVASSLAWLMLWSYRQNQKIHVPYIDTFRNFQPRDYLITFLFIPVGWSFAYLMSGTYFDLYRKSRLNDIIRTLISCIIGCIM